MHPKGSGGEWSTEEAIPPCGTLRVCPGAHPTSFLPALSSRAAGPALLQGQMDPVGTGGFRPGSLALGAVGVNPTPLHGHLSFLGAQPGGAGEAVSSLTTQKRG